MNQDDMNEEMFQEALTEVMKKLDEANKCYSFNLVRVIEATKQVVAGLKYVMRIEITPICTGEKDEECSRLCETGLDTNKETVVSVVSKPWGKTKHLVKFNPLNECGTDFNEKGELNPEWTKLSQEDKEASDFKNAVQNAITKLNRDYGNCFQYELLEVLSGKKRLADRTEYVWDMKVKVIYDESPPGCLGACADECSGTMVFTASASVSPLEGREPELSKISFKKTIDK